MKPQIPPFSVWHVATGSAINGHPGDIFLTHRAGPASRLIGFGERVRRKTRPYAYWTHAGVFIPGGIVEALTAGVTVNTITAYRDVPYVIIHWRGLNPILRVNMVAYALSTVGDEYNWLEILASGINMASGSSVSLGVDGHQICSGLAASMMLRAGAILDMSSDHVTPADLGRYFKVAR